MMDFWRISVTNQLDCIKPKKEREDVAPQRNQCSKTPRGTFT